MDKIRGLVITHKGTEDVAAKEVAEILKAKPEVREMCVAFEVKEIKELCRLCYLSQAASRVLFLFDNFKISPDFEETIKAIMPRLEKFSLEGWASKDTRFKVECRREGKHDFTSQTLAEWLADKIGDKILAECKVEPVADLKSPNLIFYVLVTGEEIHLGIDLAGFDLSKRDYKIMSHMPSIKGTIGYGLLRIVGYERKQSLLDVSSYSGVIPIEAAIYASERSVNYYRKQELHFTKFSHLKEIDFELFFESLDKKRKEKVKGAIVCMNNQFRYISTAKNNSKIAGVNKLIDFSRFDIEWLDTKFGKNMVDLIASNSPRVSSLNERLMEKIYNELFYQANYILKKTGRIGLLTNSTEVIKAAAKKNMFRLSEERSVWQGEEELKVVVFEKETVQ
jgi:23S rRNA G2445 N2-methylase RlmL